MRSRVMVKRDAIVMIHKMKRPREDHNKQGGGQKNCSNNNAKQKNYKEQGNGQKNGRNNNARQENHDLCITITKNVVIVVTQNEKTMIGP